MVARKPLVLVNGRPAQMPAGDSLDAVVSEVDVWTMTNADATAHVIGTPVYISAAGSVRTARANAIGTTDVIAFCRESSIAASASGTYQTDGVLVATTAQWDAVAGTTGGLTAGATYFLSSAVAGRITATAPTNTGEFVLQVGKAIRPTELEITISIAIGL